MNDDKEFEASMRAMTRAMAIGEEYLDWLYNAESIYCDHQWLSDDYAGPDSGYAGATCSKCGASFGEFLY